MKRYLLLAAVSVSVGLLFGTSACKKDVPAAPEAGVVAEVDAAPPPAETAAADVDAAPAATLSAAPAAKVAAKPAEVKVAEGGAYQGTYKCMGGMTVTQKGNAVEVRTFPAKTDGYSTISCTANGDSCNGTVTEFKNGAAAGKRNATLTRNDKGDLTYKGEGEAKGTFCKKN